MNERPGRDPRIVWVCLFLVLATLLLYGQTVRFEFVNYDDPLNVYENTHVQAGLTWEGVRWAFTTTEADYWKPLPRLSHMLDWQLFGSRAGGHHLTNVLLHAACVLVLFVTWKRMTGQIWLSAFVAALFALHPLHVSSVAWVTERKDVLSGLFWMLSLWAYARYAERPGSGRYLLIVLFFSLGLMSKPMLVTLPFVLLLLDVWPLGRLPLKPAPTVTSALRLVWEKLPLFLLSALSCVGTLLSTSRSGQLAPTESFSPGIRVANALVSYVRYMGKMIWPSNLSSYYPHPGHWPLWAVAGAIAVLLAITAAVVRNCRQRPYLLVGWLWYLGTLLPVIGLIQGKSEEAMADRFVYLPLTGLYVIVSWGIPDLLARWRSCALALRGAACIVILELSVISWFQVQTWRDSKTLCLHALQVTRNNPIAHNNLGVALAAEKRYEEAIAHYSEAIRIWPHDTEAWYNMGNTLAALGRKEEALSHYSEAIRLNPNHGPAHYNLGMVLASKGLYAEAIAQYRETIRINPDQVEAHSNMGTALVSMGKTEEAIAQYSEALRIAPNHAKTHYNLAAALAARGSLDEAIVHYSRAVQLKPDYAEAHNNWGLALAQQGKLDEAITHYSRALQLKPDYDKAHYNLGLSLSAQGKSNEANAQFKEALRLNPKLPKPPE